MPRPLPAALIATLCLVLNALAIDKTPGAIKRIVEKAVTELKKNHQHFDQANHVPLTDARDALRALTLGLSDVSSPLEAEVSS